MRTTVVVADDVLRQARIRAAENGSSLSAVIEEGLRLLLVGDGGAPRQSTPLPTHGRGGLRPGVDLDDNRAIRDLLDSER